MNSLAPRQSECPECGYLYRPLETTCPRCSQRAPASAAAESDPASTPDTGIATQSIPLLDDRHNPATDSAPPGTTPTPEPLSPGARAWAIAAIVWGVFHTVALGFLVLRFVFSVVIVLAPFVLPLPFATWTIARGGEGVLKQVPGARRVLQTRLGLGSAIAFLLLAVYRSLIASKRFPLAPDEALEVLQVTLIQCLEFTFLFGLYLVSKLGRTPDRETNATVDSKK